MSGAPKYRKKTHKPCIIDTRAVVLRRWSSVKWEFTTWISLPRNNFQILSSCPKDQKKKKKSYEIECYKLEKSLPLFIYLFCPWMPVLWCCPASRQGKQHHTQALLQPSHRQQLPLCYGKSRSATAHESILQPRRTGDKTSQRSEDAGASAEPLHPVMDSPAQQNFLWYHQVWPGRQICKGHCWKWKLKCSSWQGGIWRELWISDLVWEDSSSRQLIGSLGKQLPKLHVASSSRRRELQVFSMNKLTGRLSMEVMVNAFYQK